MYSRFKALSNYGEKDLERLKSSTVAVVGLGATGSVITENLARHGVKLVLIDRDYLEPKDCYSSNIYTTADCQTALPKAKAAEKYLEQFTAVKSYIASLNPDNIDLISEADLIMDGTDNFYTRQLINDYSKKNEVPWVYTAAIAENGYSMIIDQNCFNCVFDNSSTQRTCETHGIMREISGIAALKSTLKAVQYLTDKDVDQRLERIPSGEKLNVESNGCEVCRRESFPHLDNGKRTTALCGEDKYEIDTARPIDQINIPEDNIVVENKYLTRLEIEDREMTVFNDGRIILNARDSGHAEQLCSEILGL